MAGKIVQFRRRSEPRKRRNASIGFAGVAALCAAALVVCGLAGCGAHAPAAASQAGGPGGPFNLVDDTGQPVDQTVLKGKWSVVFFGYTFCPDYCPTTLTMLGQAMNQLGPEKARRVQVVFVTVDPGRDTPAQLKTYLSSPVFPKNAIGLTGTPAEIERAAKAYYVYYQKAGTGPNYTVDHTTVLYLMDPNGRFIKPIAEGVAPEEVARQISEAMAAA